MCLEFVAVPDGIELGVATGGHVRLEGEVDGHGRGDAEEVGLVDAREEHSVVVLVVQSLDEVQHLFLLIVVELGLRQFLGTEVDALPVDACHVLFELVVTLEVLHFALVDVESLLLQTGRD